MKLFLFLPVLTLSFFGLFAEAQTTPTTLPQPRKLLMLGDSLTEGLGVAREQAYPALVEKKIKADGKNWVVINAGISGSTSASGPSRMKWQLKAKPDMVLIALGANDGLRGFKVTDIEKNLSAVIEMAQKEKVTVILAAMMMPPNYGEQYRKDFEALYPKLAKKYNIMLLPFFLKDVAGQSALNQADGVHPNEKGYIIIANNVYQAIKGML